LCDMESELGLSDHFPVVLCVDVSEER